MELGEVLNKILPSSRVVIVDQDRNEVTRGYAANVLINMGSFLKDREVKEISIEVTMQGKMNGMQARQMLEDRNEKEKVADPAAVDLDFNYTDMTMRVYQRIRVEI